MFHIHFKRRAPIVGCVCVCRTADNVIDNNSSVCLVNQIIIENPSKAAQQQQQKQQQWKKQQSSRNNNNNNNKNEHGRAPKCVFILVFPTEPSLLFLNARALFFIFLLILFIFFFCIWFISLLLRLVEFASNCHLCFCYWLHKLKRIQANRWRSDEVVVAVVTVVFLLLVAADVDVGHSWRIEKRS